MKVFILEDNPDRFKFLKKFYTRDTISWAQTYPEAKKIFEMDGPFDLLLLDHDLGEEEDIRVGNGEMFAEYLAGCELNGANIIIHSMNSWGAQRMKHYLPKAELVPIILW